MAKLQQLAHVKRSAKAAPRHSRTRAIVKLALQTAFASHFKNDGLVDVSDGYANGIHIVVVSRRFDGMPEQTRQTLLWKIVNDAPLTTREKDLITLLYAVSPGEIA